MGHIAVGKIGCQHRGHSACKGVPHQEKPPWIRRLRLVNQLRGVDGLDHRQIVGGVARHIIAYFRGLVLFIIVLQIHHIRKVVA